jgi:hypothetical protein
MKRHLAVLAAVLVLGVAAIGTASAHTGFAISIGIPVPGVAYAPPPAYYGPTYAYPYYYPAGPVVYGYYGPYGHYRYWHR